MILKAELSSLLVYLLLFIDCLPSKIRQRQESHLPLILQLWHALVCQVVLTHLHLTLSWIVFVCSTLHFIALYSLFIYQYLLTVSDLPLPFPHTFLSVAFVAYSYTQPLSALNVSCHDLFFSFFTYPVLSINIYAK